MTLSTHIIIASAIAKPLAAQNPIIAFLAALASHYLSDAIPHWDYSLESATNDKDPTREKIIFTKKTLYHDLPRISIDLALGSAITWYLLHPVTLHQYLFLAAVIIGGVLPDFLQGVYYGMHHKSLKIHQDFHDRMHTKIKLGPYPLIGIPFQLFIVAIAYVVLR